MSRTFLILITVSLLVGMVACKEQPKTAEKLPTASLPANATNDPDEPSPVGFDLKPVESSNDPNGTRNYECVYESKGKTARFRLQFQSPGSAAHGISFSEGKIQAVNGSDNSALLAQLKVALAAKTIPKESSRVTELPFDLAILGVNQSRDVSGSFSDKPPGDWIAIKLFFPQNGDDGEVYLNINPVLGKGEFSIKDSDYGDYLLAEFAKVL